MPGKSGRSTAVWFICNGDEVPASQAGRQAGTLCHSVSLSHSRSLVDIDKMQTIHRIQSRHHKQIQNPSRFWCAGACSLTPLPFFHCENSLYKHYIYKCDYKISIWLVVYGIKQVPERHRIEEWEREKERVYERVISMKHRPPFTQKAQTISSSRLR